MFTKLSRYRKLADVSAPDARGRTVVAKSLRLLPEVSGSFRHTVESGDRVDQLAYKYYSQALQWWAICDANPDFLSPLAMLGKEALTTTRFPLDVVGVPAWADMVQALHQTLGVEAVRIEEDIELVPGPATVAGQTISAMVERFSRAVLVTRHRLLVSPADLADLITATGFQVGPFADLEQTGLEIVIPPKPIG
jgi:phage tail protein X